MADSAAAYLRRHQQALAEEIVRLQYQAQGEVWKPYGEPGHQKSVRDAGYHLAYLAEACDADDPLLFAEYLAWVKVLFAGLGFPATVLPATLTFTRQVLSEKLPAAERAAALAVLDVGSQELERAPDSLPGLLTGDEPQDHLARQYLAALLRIDRRAASQMILDAVEAGTEIKTIYTRVFQRTQREIGRLWQTNQINVAQEHYCTAATQMIMSQLYPYIFTGARKERCIVVACVGGELHEIGARMVADFCEMSGWDSCFLGASTPQASILQTVIDQEADILALSATMTFHVSRAAEIIRSLRAASPRTRVLVGGYPFNLSRDLWRRIGADGYAPDAEQAVAEAERVVSGAG
jgi:MerR family transcriptional regulator, light-induced transcriptional regulator